MDNRTGIIMLQHPRERFHPLNTARLAWLGLSQVRLEVAWGEGGRGLTRRLSLPPDTALLYPHESAVPLEQCTDHGRPRNLLLLDGTWAHARQLYRANPWLEELPHVQLRPGSPGRYRIRGEPAPHCLSTIEAVVEALRILEPETAGLEQLLTVFDATIEAQVEQIRSRSAGPRRKLRRRAPRLLPPALLGPLDRIVVAYGESVPGPGGGRRLVQWTAVRPAVHRTFERLLRPEGWQPDPRHLAHMRLDPADLGRGVNAERFAREWNAFLGRDAVLVAWNRSTLDLGLAQTSCPPTAVLLKAVYCNVRHAACGALDDVVQREGLRCASTPFQGRAGQRVAQVLAVLDFLRRRAGCPTPRRPVEMT